MLSLELLTVITHHGMAVASMYDYLGLCLLTKSKQYWYLLNYWG